MKIYAYALHLAVTLFLMSGFLGQVTATIPHTFTTKNIVMFYRKNKTLFRKELQTHH